MRVLQLTSHLETGGITTYVATVSQALAARGHQVIVASGGGSWQSRLDAHAIPHWRLPLATSAEFSPQVWWAARQLSRRLQQQPVDVIHAHTRVAQVVADRLSRRHRIPYVTTWHGFYRRRWSRRWWPCTGAITMAISAPVAAHLRDVFRVPAARIQLIPHGIDAASFIRPIEAAQQQQLRQQCGLPDTGPVIGTVSRLVPDKGVAQLLEGFRHVKASVPRAHLLIIGDGRDRPQLERLADQLLVAEAVRFLGNVPDARAPLAVMDVFVFLPATREGFGLSLLEAMAAGRPIVSVQRGGGASWVLQESGVGLTVPAEEPLQLGQALVQVLQDQVLAQQLGRRAQDVARSQYDLVPMVTQIEHVYQAAAGHV